jgi:hypothetical protein
VIVARSYVNLLPSRDTDLSARDRVGHGTALAIIAAGARSAGPLATITGVAPAAWVGNYKVFGTPGINDGTNDAAVLKAIDDAVADGMDIINLSLGDDMAPRLEDDIEVEAIERATRAGVIVVAAAGNNGPGRNTISSPATAPSAIAVGATTNGRLFGSSVSAAGLGSFFAIAANGFANRASVTASFGDVAWVDQTGMACESLPADSLSGRIAVIVRGGCTFELKLTNARNAGAVGALVYAAQDQPDAIGMSVGAATLPAEMVSYSDGIALRVALLTQPFLQGTLSFQTGSVEVQGNRLAGFSARGPGAGVTIKPDISGTGDGVYTGTQTLDSRGDMYDPSGYILVDGTSFSAPLVAGAAALIKSARPGLTVDQYRSLLINTANDPAQAYGVQQTGSGILNALGALGSTVTVAPVSLSFGAGGSTQQSRRSLTLSNVGTSAEVFVIEPIAANGPAPFAGVGSIEIAPGASIEVPIVWDAGGLAAGPYEGFLRITGTNSGTVARVPYWFAVASNEPASITILSASSGGRRGSVQRNAVYFRILDAAGLVLPAAEAQITVVAGDGLVRGVASLDRSIPGLFSLSLQLGLTPGVNTFRITAGSVSTDVSLTGQ